MDTISRKRILTFFLIVLFTSLNCISYPAFKVSATSTNNEIQAAPLNENFIDFQNTGHQNLRMNSSSTLNNNTTSNDTNLGYIPAPIGLQTNSSYDSRSKLFQYFPSTYDLRTTLGKLSPIRNQGSSGSCWSFATYGSLESYLRPATVTDFSENNLKNTSGFDYGPNAGGNQWMSSAYLARWSGPVSESADPYNPTSTTSPSLPSQKHVQQIMYLPNRTSSLDNNQIKDAVMKYGGVVTSFLYEAGCFNNQYDTYFDSYKHSANHEVDIIGWDDNFDKNKFYDSIDNTKPAGNGAFIARNSWGSSWGDNGYFYISYYDVNVGGDLTVYNNAESTSNYASIYQYDPLGATQIVGYPNSSTPNTAWFANVFTANSNQALSAVSFYSLVNNSNYEVYVCSTFNSSSDLSSSRILVKTGTLNTSGYYTVKLNSPVPLSAGKKFAVIVKLTTPGSNYPVSIESRISGYSSNAAASPGQSYISNLGSSWSDLTSFSSTANVCLKAFTTNINYAPKVISTVPTNGSINVPVNSSLTINFSENIFAGSTFNNITVKNSSGVIIPVTRTISGNRLIIKPTADLKNSTLFTVTLPAGAVKDNLGAPLASSYAFSFTTIPNYPPKVISTVPSSGSINVPVNSSLTINFSENIFAGSTFNNITVKNSSGVIIPVTRTISGNRLIIKPTADLKNSTLFTVTIPTGAVKDNLGAPLASNYAFSFTTIPNYPPKVISTVPSNGSINVLVNSSLTINFSENIFAGSAFNNITVKNSSGVIIPVTRTISGNRLIIKPTADLKNSTLFTVTIPTGAVKDNLGAPLASNYAFSFTTIPNYPPKVISTVPSNGSINVSISSSLTINFSENIFAGSTFNNITVKNSSGVIIPVTRTISGNRLIIKPTTYLKKNAVYTVTIPTGAVKDNLGAPLANNYIFNFKTVPY